MKIKEFINEFEQIIPVRQAEDFDNVGLLCGNPDREITGILIAHDALENVIDEAIGKKLNFRTEQMVGLKNRRLRKLNR